MNILILTPYLPFPLNSGGAQGMFNMIDQLRHKHHYTMVISAGPTNTEDNKAALQELWPEVDIIYYPFWKQLLCPSFLYEKMRRVLLRKLMPNSRRLAVEMATRPYGEWFSSQHVNFVKDIIQQKHIDLIQVEFYECLPWAAHLPATDNKKLFIHHELGFMRKERLLADIPLSDDDRERLAESKRTEFRHLELYDAVVTVTETDKNILKGEGLKTPVFVSPSAINTTSCPYSVAPGQLTFVGGHGHLPNKEGIDWFVSHVAPLLKEEHFTLNLIGKSWPAAYSECKDVKIMLRGFVEKLADVVSGNIMIVPILSGSGMRMKILEGAAMSMPIVTTTVGVEGLEFKDGESCLVADTPADFANAIKRLCDDPVLRKTLGENANKVFAAKYHPSVLAAVRDSIYEELYRNS